MSAAAADDDDDHFDVLASSFGQIIFSFQFFREPPLEQTPKRTVPLTVKIFSLT